MIILIYAISNVYIRLLNSFINRDDVDFDVAESYTPVQTWELVEGSDDVVEYATRLVRSLVDLYLNLYMVSTYS